MADPTSENRQDKDVLFQIEHIKQYFPIRQDGKRKVVKAVDDISLTIHRGETLGIVGESGCGKSTLGRTILRLIEPTEGRLIFEGEDITKGDTNHLRQRMQIIFQDPYASLDPRMTVGDIVGEPLDIHGLCKNKEERQQRIYDMLRTVGLSEEHADRYPHEFSGGQRQRVGIARALILKPDFIVCDEPVSALDVSIQAQVVNMLTDLREEHGYTYLFIAHDLAVVHHISDRIGVMYLGHLVELADCDDLYESPRHPYTAYFLSAIPVADPIATRDKKREVLTGEVPSPINPPTGCVFHPRCPFATDICRKEMPAFEACGDGHFVACHHPIPTEAQGGLKAAQSTLAGKEGGGHEE